MFKVGEKVKWRSSLDEDYSYGTILEIRRSTVIVEGSGYYKGTKALIRLRDMEKLEKGGKGFGGSEKHHK